MKRMSFKMMKRKMMSLQRFLSGAASIVSQSRSRSAHREEHRVIQNSLLSKTYVQKSCVWRGNYSYIWSSSADFFRCFSWKIQWTFFILYWKKKGPDLLRLVITDWIIAGLGLEPDGLRRSPCSSLSSLACTYIVVYCERVSFYSVGLFFFFSFPILHIYQQGLAEYYYVSSQGV